MLDGVVVRERTCPSCRASVRERSARWCGSCGAPLSPVTDDPDPTRDRAPRWRRALLGAGAAAAVAAVVLAGGGLVDRASRTATVDDAAVAGPDVDALDDLPRATPPPPEPTTEPTCSDGPRFGCFAWAVEHSEGREFFFGSTVIADGYVVAIAPEAGRLTAYDLHDGTPAWAVAVEGAPDGSASHQVAEDLVLHHADGALLARDLATGEERWRNTELAPFTPHRAQRHDDLVLVAGHQGGLSSAGPFERGEAVAALDATTGELRWHHGGDAVALAPGGIGLTLDEGRLRAYDLAGDLSWDVDAGTGDGSQGGIWVTGNVISVHSDADLMRLHRLGDGEPLPFAAEPLGSDGTATLMVEIEPAGEGGGYSHGDEWILLDDAGEVWRTPVVDQFCFGPVTFEAETISFTGCDGGEVVLDRADGTLRSRTAVDPEDRGGFSFGYSVGPYELHHEGTGVDELVVVDGRTGTEVARLPTETWPVEHADALHWQPTPSDGVLVLQSRGWLVALEVPEPGPGDRDAAAPEE